MKFKFIADTHCGAPHECMSIEEICNNKDAYLLGDIIDAANVPKKKVSMWRSKQRLITQLFKSRYIFGNHECLTPIVYYKKVDNILMCHGHTLNWTRKKVIKWENKKAGRSKLSYFFYRFKHLVVNRGKKMKFNKKLFDKCIAEMTIWDCDTIVMGHFHREGDFSYQGKRIIFLKRGLTEIEL